MPASAGTAIRRYEQQQWRGKMLRDCAKLLKKPQSVSRHRMHSLESRHFTPAEPHRARFATCHPLVAIPARTSTCARVRDRRCSNRPGARLRRRADAARDRCSTRSARHHSLPSRHSGSFRRRVPRSSRVERAGDARRSAASDVGRCLCDDGRLHGPERDIHLECPRRMRIGHQAPRRDRVGDQHRKRWPRKTPVTRASFASRHP